MEQKVLSAMPKLGFGMMRLPVVEGGDIDMPALCQMVDTYMAAGLNYFDTAYPYHQGRSERAVKTALVDRYPRETFMLTTKLPAWQMKKIEDREAIFHEQLERTGAGYFDFYLLHAMEEGNNYEVYEKGGCFDWLKEKKAAGLIRHYGFSFHGSPELLEKVLDDHPDVDVVQIQLNYLDWENPVRRCGEQYEILRKRNIPILVMEPVKGGAMASFHPDVEKIFKAARPDASIASWALRFVASLPGIATVLSGMSTPEQMEDNLKTFRYFEPLTEEEKRLVEQVKIEVLNVPQIECTACRYCCDGCPMHINIPELFKAYNTSLLYPTDVRAKRYYNDMTAGGAGLASACLHCGQCEEMCPQHLNITSYLETIAQKFEA